MTNNRIDTVPVKSQGRFLDRHKSEILISLRFPITIYLLFLAFAYLIPSALSLIFAGGVGAYFTGLLFMFFAALCTIVAVKTFVSSVLQILMLHSLRTMQFAKTKQLSLRGLKFLRRWPMVHNSELIFFEVGLGAVCMGRADYDEAEELFFNCVERVRKILKSRIVRRKWLYYPNMAVLLCHLSRAYSSQDRFEEAERAAMEGLEFARNIGRYSYARVEVFPLFALAYTHLRSGELEKAEKEYNQVIQLNASTKAPPSYGNSVFAPIMQGCRVGLATIAIKKGDAEASKIYWHEYLGMVHENAAALSPSFLRSFNLLANDYMNAKLYDQAEDVIDFAYALAKQYFDHPDAQETLNYFEKLLLLTDRQSEIAEMRAWLRLSAQERMPVTP
jgi:tetratricopeptide (TPR) repeat protein